ncbi:MAG: chromosomal replication initiator protein DnaA, partial [Deltaproteobacteria bacterium]|nr:chromosomal replication initiator protein DnaA [Deltaproteobacteria bacterium]
MEAIWKEVKTKIKKHLPDHSYRMWIEPIEFNKYTDDTVILSSPNFFCKRRVQNHYGSLLESEINKASGRVFKVSIEVGEKQDDTDKKLDSKKQKIQKLDEGRQLNLPNLNIKPNTGRMLRKTFTFDEFVVGDNNKFAYSAALSLASRKNSNQDALFLLSKPGMGKSHLSQAIGHHILSKYPSERVYYITAEDFTNEMIHGFQHNSIDKFKEKYRTQCDVLLLDDVHFLTGKERTQVELAMALDYLFEADKKIIFSSCYLPSDIPKMSEQLRSRLSSGLISDINAPDFRTRVRILKKKSQQNGYNIPRNVIDYLAGELADNVRQLESGLIGVSAKSSLLNRPIDLSLAESV